MQSIQKLILCLLVLALSIQADNTTSQEARYQEMINKINAIKDKESAADFNNNELEKKKFELQKTLQEQLNIISQNIPAGTTDAEKAAKANALDERSYIKIKLELRKKELQAHIKFIQTSLQNQKNELQALKTRSSELQAKISSNKENGTTMLPTRKDNLQKQQTKIQNDINELLPKIKTIQDQLQQFNETLNSLQKVINNPNYK